MKALITGASGLLGRRMFDIISKSHETVGTYNKNNSGDFHFLDISDKNSVDLFFEKIKPELVIHCAALVDADYCEKDKQTAKKININGTKNVVRACKNLESKLIFISSDYIFKGNNPPYTEESIPDPVNYYGITKVEGERLVKENLSQFLIIRSPLMYGNDEGTKPSFITQIVSGLQENKKVFVDNKIIKYPTLTDDVVTAIVRLMESNANGIYNVCASEAITKYIWAKKIAERYGFSLENIVEKNNHECAERPLNAQLDSSKIKKLGIEFTTIDEGLQKTFKTEHVKKYNFKIVRSDQVPLEDRGLYGGYAIRRLFTELLPKNAENIGFYETTVRPNNSVKNHYHNNSDEIFYFFTNGILKIGQETVLVQPRDIVILPRGVPHELIANDKEIKLLAIKIPNIPDDKILY